MSPLLRWILATFFGFLVYFALRYYVGVPFVFSMLLTGVVVLVVNAVGQREGR